MQIPKTTAAWKRLQPTSIVDALRLCKEFARSQKRLTVPAIAELMGVTEDSLYKWFSSGRMPVVLIPVYEHVCGIDYVTKYLAYRAHKLIIDIPTGATASEKDIANLQLISADAMSLLIRHYRNGEDPGKTIDALCALMRGVAYHSQNIQTQPELDFGAQQ